MVFKDYLQVYDKILIYMLKFYFGYNEDISIRPKIV